MASEDERATLEPTVPHRRTTPPPESTPLPRPRSERGEVLLLTTRAGVVDELEPDVVEAEFDVRVRAPGPMTLDELAARPPACVLACVDPGDPRVLDFCLQIGKVLYQLAPAVIAVVSTDDEATVERALVVGVRDVLVRPVPRSLLKVKLARHARRRTQIGRTIAGFHLEALIGRGGMGTVYLARRDWDQARVALKLLDAVSVQHEPEVLARFHREADALRQVRHPCVPRFLGSGRSEGCFYYVMEYVEGRTISATLYEGPLRADDVERLIVDVGGALAAMHQAGLVHRDVKPGNVMFRPTGGACLIDFGLAKLEDDLGLTRENEIVGTLAYMAPELFRGDPATPASDAYGLGMTAYHAALGECPIEGSGMKIMAKVAAGDFPRPSSRVPWLPEPLLSVLEGLVEPVASRRLGVAEAVAALGG